MAGASEREDGGLGPGVLKFLLLALQSFDRSLRIPFDTEHGAKRCGCRKQTRYCTKKKNKEHGRYRNVAQKREHDVCWSSLPAPRHAFAHAPVLTHAVLGAIHGKFRAPRNQTNRQRYKSPLQSRNKFETADDSKGRNSRRR